MDSHIYEILKFNLNTYHKNITDSDLIQISNFINSKFKFNKKLVIGTGATCILAFRDDKQVVKICIKSNQGVMKDSNSLKNHVKKIEKNGIPICKILDIIYETSNIIIYCQELSTPIKLNWKYFAGILEIVDKLIQSDYRIGDIYYKNFGICQNQIKLFDFHDDFCNKYNYVDIYIELLSNMISFLQYKRWYKSDIIKRGDRHYFYADQFGKGYLDDDYVALLESIYYEDHKLTNTLITMIRDKLNADDSQK
jgi:hypothetical protein